MTTKIEKQFGTRLCFCEDYVIVACVGLPHQCVNVVGVYKASTSVTTGIALLA